MGLHNIMDKKIRYYVLAHSVIIKYRHYYLDSFIIYVRGYSFTRGDQNFLCRPRGGPEFFAHAEGGTKFFLRMPRGGPEKLATRDHRQTAPLPVKNDSSLKRVLVYAFKLQYLDFTVQESGQTVLS